MSTIKRYKKQCLIAVVFIVFGMMFLCFHNSVHAKQNIKMKTKNMVLVSGESKKLKVNGIKKNSKIRWKSSNKRLFPSAKRESPCKEKRQSGCDSTIQKKKLKCKVTVVSKANAKQDQKEITLGTSYYRNFLVDNVYHSGKNGDIHYNVYFPDSYDGKKEDGIICYTAGISGFVFSGCGGKSQDRGFCI